jgi:xanthine dehydrogenase small subunit
MPGTRFILNNNMVETGIHPSTTLLDYIRYEANLKGTKIGCREGDCGACTVLIGEPGDNGVRYISATSCLTPLANATGRHVVTVEGLELSGMNKVQSAMVENSGTQCGFCTPGFVVSLCGFAIQATKIDGPEDVIGSVDGNICRCTGYKSIERACRDIWDSLQHKDIHKPLEWLAENGFIPPYFLKIPDRLKQIQPQARQENGLPIAGGTDLYVQKHDDIDDIPLHYLKTRPTDPPIIVEGRKVHFSGICTVTDMLENRFLSENIAGWYGFMKLVSSTPIRNIATVGGNLVNASPIGDLTIILLALDATIELTSPSGIRILPLKEFYKGYKTLDKQPDEIISKVSFDLPEATRFNFEKVCKRTYLDIASVNTAISIQKQGKKIISAHCSAGGIGPVPTYLHATSAFLSGKEVSVRVIREAAEVIESEISPISDVRGSAEYKRDLLKNLFKGHFLSLFPEILTMEELV